MSLTRGQDICLQCGYSNPLAAKDVCERETERMCMFFAVKLPKETSSKEEEGENQCDNGEARLRDMASCLL